MSKIIFIAGTDTNIGKTMVTGLFARFLLDQGYSVVTQKWAQSGSSSSSYGDIETHLKIMAKGKKDYQQYLPLMNPYSFRLAASPHLAARAAGVSIDTAKLKKSTRNLAREFNFVLIEGTGGLLVPFNEKELLIDLIAEMSLPVILICGNKLGTINHTLLSLEALKARKIKTLGLIFNATGKKENKIILKDNLEIIEKISKIKCFGALPWTRNLKQLQNLFSPIGERLIATLAVNTAVGRKSANG